MDEKQRDLHLLLEQLKLQLDEQARELPELQVTKLAQLVGRVEDILNSPPPEQALTQTGSLISQPDSGDVDALDIISSVTAEWTGKTDEQQIAGRYRLIQKLGEGGMGQVWMAQQSSPIKRKVALKLIKAGLDSKSVLSRFEQERQALAMMDHPNIAKVYDAGASEQGTPFFVMELVNGPNLLAYCDLQRLSLEKRLELFIPICQAVQHAHQKGIIHRDLKPANILVVEVDGKPVPKVIDFGVAKATSGKLIDATLTTQMGAILGTLEYMAPEQAGVTADDVDTRADIYSLGVILYELLTGLRPFDSQRLKKAVFAELYRIIHDEVPSKPSTRFSTADGVDSLASVRMTEPKKLAAKLRGELDWIVMKCLEKQRDRRYETANSLSRDLQRFLASEPIEARPPSSRYLVLKFLSRNKSTVSAAALMLGGLVSGVLVALWGWHEARKQQEIAQVAFTKETAQRQESDRQRSLAELAMNAEKQARQQAQERTDQVVRANTVLASIFKGLNPHETEASGQPLQIKLGQQLLKVVEELTENSVGNALQTAELQVTLGESLYYLGHTEQAKDVLEKAVDIYRKANQLSSTAGMLALRDLSATWRELGEPQKSLPIAQECLKLNRELNGNDDEFLAASLNEAGLCYHELDNEQEAIRYLQEALSLRQKCLGNEHADTRNVLHNLARAKNYAGHLDTTNTALEKSFKSSEDDNLYDSLSRQQGLTELYLARDEGRKALDLEKQIYAKRVVSLGEVHAATLLSLYYLVLAHLAMKEFDTAQSLAEKLVSLHEENQGSENIRTMRAMQLLGVILADSGQTARALSVSKQVYEMAFKQRGDEDPFTIAAKSNLAVALSAEGHRAEGIKMQRDVIHLQTKLKGASSRSNLGFRNQLVMQLSDDQQYTAAIDEAKEIVRLSEEVLGQNHPLRFSFTTNLIEAYANSDQLQPAIELQRALLIRKSQSMGEVHLSTIATRSRLALLLDEAGQDQEALMLYCQVFQESATALGEVHSLTLLRGRNMAMFLRERNQVQESATLLQALLATSLTLFGPDDPETLTTVGCLASALIDLERYDEAMLICRDRLSRCEATLGAEHTQTIAALSSLVRCLDKVGETDEAEKLHKLLIERKIKTIGAENHSTANSQFSLALIYNRSKRNADAVELLKRVVAVREKLDGSQAKGTIAAKSQLAFGLDESDQGNEALPLYEEVLKHYVAKLGNTADDTLLALRNVANVLARLRRWPESQQRCQEMVEHSAEAFGGDDSRTYDAKAALAYVYYITDKYELALSLYQEVWAWREANQGPRDVDTIIALKYLGRCYLELGKTQEAIDRLLRAQDLYIAIEGDRSGNLVAVWQDLNVAYQGLGENNKSIEVLEKAYQLSEETFGRAAESTIRTMYSLAVIYRNAGDTKKSLSYLTQLFELRGAIKDEEMLSATLALHGLSLLEQKEWKAAEPAIRECLQIRERTKPDAWTTSNTRAMLGASLLGQKKLDDAEPLLLRGYQELDGFYKSARNEAQRIAIAQRLKETLARIGQLAEAKGSAANLPDWKMKLQELEK